MKAFSLYVEKNSLVHDIDPISKLYYIAFAVLLPLIQPDMRVAAFCFFINLCLLSCAGVLKNALPVFGLASFVLLTVVVIQGLFGAGNRTALPGVLGLVFYREGLLAGVRIALRAANIISSFLILVLTTKPSDLTEALVRKGLSPRIGYVISSVFQIIPEITSVVNTIADAQRSKGMETEGSFILRIKAFIPLLGPAVLNSFMNTKERAMALEVRAFNSARKKTFLNEQKAYKFSSLTPWVLGFILIAAGLSRVII